MQLAFTITRPSTVQQAVNSLATNGGPEERGAVYTRQEIVASILDLCGYTANAHLTPLRLLEPSFGNGEFLFEAVRRLIAGIDPDTISEPCLVRSLSNSIRAVELHRPTFDAAKHRLESILTESGFHADSSRLLADAWLLNDDYLLADGLGEFDIVVGNPPYVRQDRIPKVLLHEYKRRYATLYDRADLYVLFYEQALSSLKPDGHLGFICANRWMKNKYGAPLRKLVSDSFHLKFLLDLEHAPAFHSDVIAYPAITIITRADTNHAHTKVSSIHKHSIAGIRNTVSQMVQAQSDTPAVGTIAGLVRNKDPWLYDAPESLVILRQLENTYPTLEQAGCKVGIGVATGKDKVYIRPYDALPVEPTRKLPLVVAKDCKDGEIHWSGKGIVNPYLESGQLAPLDHYPLFAQYLNGHSAELQARHTAKKQPDKWYRTIDRIYPDLTRTPKLLIPDIKGDATVAYDPGQFYPHHNLYVVTSDTWNLRALQALLRSSFALLFVASYGVRMSGGFLRFQAQYLRRIRCPHWEDVTSSQREALISVATSDDQAAVDKVVASLYGLTLNQQNIVSSYAQQARSKPSRRG